MSIVPCPVSVTRDLDGDLRRQGVEQDSRSERIVHSHQGDMVDCNSERYRIDVVMLAVLLPAPPIADSFSAAFHEILLSPEIFVERVEAWLLGLVCTKWSPSMVEGVGELVIWASMEEMASVVSHDSVLPKPSHRTRRYTDDPDGLPLTSIGGVVLKDAMP